MRLQQLQFIREIANHDLNISEAAHALNASQPGVSQQVRLLEQELGVVIFTRNRSRVTGITETGRKVLAYARRVLGEVENLRKVCEDHRREKQGSLVVAATNAHARYVLPAVMRSFIAGYPEVTVTVRQGYPNQVWKMLSEGAADLAFASEPKEPLPELTLVKCHETPRLVLTPPRHPLLRLKKVTLANLASYPIITHDEENVTRSRVVRAFEEKGLSPKLVLRAANTDVMKGYVELGLGIAIASRLSFDPKRDRGLRAIDASEWFEPTITYLGFRHDDYFRTFVLDFIRLLAPSLDVTALRQMGASLLSRQP